MRLIEERQHARKTQTNQSKNIETGKLRTPSKTTKSTGRTTRKLKIKTNKQTQNGFTPQHTKLRHQDGTIASSAEMPTIIADDFEHTQWGNTKAEKLKTKHDNTREHRKYQLYQELANIKTGN